MMGTLAHRVHLALSACKKVDMDFQNTEKAFARWDDKQLKRAHSLFKLMGLPGMSSVGPKLASFGLKLGLPFAGQMGGQLFRHFCGGDSIDASRPVMQDLGKYGIHSILDYAVEGEQKESAFELTEQELFQVIAVAAESKDIPFAVFKPSAIGRIELLTQAQADPGSLDRNAQNELERFRERFWRICKAAHEAGIGILVDAEETWIQEIVDAEAEKAMEAFNKERATVYNTVQLYRLDRMSYVAELIQRSYKKGIQAGLKLVRGAYMEKERKRAADQGYPSPIHVDKEATDRDFDLCLGFCLSRLDILSVCIGTHNEKSTMRAVQLLGQHEISPGHEKVWFSQLYGMSDHISFNLTAAGYNVAKYVPYGPLKKVMPYLLRRAEENSAVRGTIGRELELLQFEMKRRGMVD